MDIINEIKRLPNLYYDYFGVDGKIHVVILGGASCPKSDDYPFWESAQHYFNKLCDIYNKKPFSEDDKNNIAYCFKKIKTACPSRAIGTHSIQQQEEYITSLKKDELLEITEQVSMYKECYQIYLDYIK